MTRDENSRPVRHISTAPLGPELNNIKVAELAYFSKHPEHELMRLVVPACSVCGQPVGYETPILFENVSACESCRDKHDRDEAMARAKKHWDRICPSSFRDTDTTHAGFPRAVYSSIKDWACDKSLFFYGPTGSGKTRVAFLMLKRAMLKNNHTGVLWPEQIKSLTQGYDNSTFDHFASFDVLLMDDPLITACRESKMVDVLKQLIDVRMRHKKPTIFTSQIGSENEITDGKEFGEAKTADLERIKAIVRRLREDCQVVSFAKATPTEGEEVF